MPKIDYKKILLIILFLIVVTLLGYLLYIVFFKAPTPAININIPGEVVTPGLPGGLPAEEKPPVEVPPITGLPGAPGVVGIPTVPTAPTTVPQITTTATGGMVIPTALVNANASSVKLSSNGSDLAYYDKSSGYFYKVTAEGEKQLMSDQAFKNVETVTWSNNTQKAVLEYPDGSNVIYNFQTKKTVTLPQYWKDFSFSTDSNQIVFKDMKLDSENRWLAVADDQGQNKRLIEPLGGEDADVFPSWSPNNETAALFREGYDLTRSKVYFVGFNGENNKAAVVEGRDFRFQWSPQGAKLLYSVYSSTNDYKPSLWITNAQGDLIDTGRTNLDLNTWADKCTFADSVTLYCAVPKEIAQYGGIEPSLNDNIGDNFYRVDLTTMTKKLIAEPIFKTTVDTVSVSADKKYLYYTEKSTGSIKKINL